MRPRITGLRRMPEHGPEAPWIVESEHTALQGEIDVIVRAQGRVRCDPGEGPGHAQMDDERPGLEAQQEVLGSPLDSEQGAPRQSTGRFNRHRPSQIRSPRDKRKDSAADGPLGHPSTDDFDFWEFGHGRAVYSSLPFRP